MVYQMIGLDRQLPEGPPTQEDIKLIKDEWYLRIPSPTYLVRRLARYKVMDYDSAPKYGCVVYRYSDGTYWYIRDIFQMYYKWLGPVVPYEVVPVKKEVIMYERRL